MGSFLSALRFAVRSLMRRPAVSLVILLTLGLGIGANAAMFSLSYTVVMAPYDFPDVGHVVVMEQTNARGYFVEDVTPAVFLELRDRAQTATFAAYSGYGGASLR